MRAAACEQMWSQGPMACSSVLLQAFVVRKLLEFLSYVNVDIICLYFSFWNELIYMIPFLNGFFFSSEDLFASDSFVFYFIQEVRDYFLL